MLKAWSSTTWELVRKAGLAPFDLLTPLQSKRPSGESDTCACLRSTVLGQPQVLHVVQGQDDSLRKHEMPHQTRTEEKTREA